MKQRPTVTFYHDIEQNVNVPCEPEACRSVLTEMLAIEASHGVHTTYNVVGALWRDQPDLVQWIDDGCHEVAFHSFHHELDCPPHEFAEEVRLCRELSPETNGYRSPRSRWNRDTLESLWLHDFAWNAESDGAAVPYFIFESLVRLPVAGDDWPLNLGRLNPDGWVERFRRYLIDRPYVAFGVHDCVVSLRPEERLRAWERCLEVAEAEGAKIVTFGDAASALTLEAAS